MRAWVLLPLVGVLAGCGTPGSNPAPLIPDQVVAVTSGPNGTIPVTGVLAAAAMYMVYDPLAPNWEIKEQSLPDGYYQMNLLMKRFNTGGDGDALNIVKRRAEALQQTNGAGRYRLVAFEQSIDSQTVGARRTATALVRMEPAYVAPVPFQPPELLKTSLSQPTKLAATPVAVPKKVAHKPLRKPAAKPSAGGCDCKD